MLVKGPCYPMRPSHYNYWQRSWVLCLRSDPFITDLNNQPKKIRNFINMHQTFLHKHCMTTSWHWLWWRHQMETFFALLAIYEGNHWSQMDSPHKGQWRGALIFLRSAPGLTMSKQLRRRRIETPLRSLWRHCNDFPHNWLAMGGFVCSRPGFYSQKPVTRNVEIFFDWHLNKRSSKQSRRRMMTPQITGVSIVCSVVGSGTEKNKSPKLRVTFVRRIHRWPMVPLTNGQ